MDPQMDGLFQRKSQSINGIQWMRTIDRGSPISGNL